MRAPASRTSRIKIRMARAVEDHDADVVDRLFERVGDGFEIFANRRVDVHVRRRFRTDGELLHI